MRANLRAISSLCAGVALASCADSTGPGASGRQPVTVSFTTSTSSASKSSADLAGTSRSITATSGADVLIITKAQVVFANLELQRAGGSCASTADAGDEHDGNDHDCAELELAPSLVDLPVTGGVATALNVTVPAGTYSQLEAKIRPVKAKKGAGSAAFLTAHPELADVSVRVEGTFNGKPFTYLGAPRAELEIAFEPPVTVADKGTNITIGVDLATWFKTASGAVIDPATANAGGTNSLLVAANIKQSFHAFHDDDRDGRDDDRQNGKSNP